MVYFFFYQAKREIRKLLGGHKLVNSLVQARVPGIKQTMEAFLQGKSFEAELDERISFDQLDESTSAVWSLLLATGYLKVLDLNYHWG